MDTLHNTQCPTGVPSMLNAARTETLPVSSRLQGSAGGRERSGMSCWQRTRAALCSPFCSEAPCPSRDVHREQGWVMALSTGPTSARQRQHLQSHTTGSSGQEQRHRAQCQPLHSRMSRSKPRALCLYQDSLHPTKPAPSSPATEISFLSPPGLLYSWTAKKRY